jgi:TonB-dependent receptor
MHKSLFVFFLLLAPCPGQVPAEQGTIAGTVYDSTSGQAVRRAAVRVVESAGTSTITDLDGNFRATVLPGTYTLEVSAPGFMTARLANVEVKAGEVTNASTVLAPSSKVTTVDVVASVDAGVATEEVALLERKLSATVSDAVSKEEIAKTVASDAAGVLEKVTGVSIVNGGYVYVRGLGERYSSAMLNGAMLPTTEPEKRVVPLDLFPSELIDSIKILKSYTPDLPGEFAGGLVQMNTVEFPTHKMLRVSTSYGFNSRTTGKPFLSYPGGGWDGFGFDDGTRSLPSLIPRDNRLIAGRFTKDQLQQFGQSFADNWEPAPVDSMRPTQTYSVVGGGTWKRVGIVGAFTFSNQPQLQSEVQRYLRQGGSGPIVFTEYNDFRDYTESARMGGVFNVALKLTDAHKLIFRNTFTHDADKEAREFGGYDGGIDSTLSSQRLRWVERGLFSTSVGGDHSLARWHNSLFHWQVTYSRSSRNEPDLREVFRGQLPDGRYTFLSLGSSALRFFNQFEDRIYEPQADWSVPMYRGAFSGLIKVGFRATLRDRDFEARRFRFIPIRTTTLDLFLPSNQLFAPGNIRPDGFQITEFTRATDTYTASMDVNGGYVMADLAFGPRWRVVGGVRVEDASILVNTLDPLVPYGTAQTASLINRDPMPAMTGIYALTPRQNLRISYSRTVSRPDFRELSPFDFNDVLGGFVSQGNPNLIRATIGNLDARWEWFPGGNQVIAASFFLKNFTNPIEVTILPSNDLRQSFVNAKGAVNRGFEIEARRRLGTFHRWLRDFLVQSNFTFVDSNISIRPEDATLLTSTERPLLGQSRYIFNATTEWVRPKWRSNARFSANYVSRRLSDVGTFGLPDIYQEASTFLDFLYLYSLDEKGRWTLKFTAENLGDNHMHWTQGGITQRSYRLGRTFSAGLSFSVF